MSQTMTTSSNTTPYSHAISTGKEAIELPRWRGKGRTITSSSHPSSDPDESTVTTTTTTSISEPPYLSPSTTLTPRSTSPPPNPSSTASTTLATLPPTRTLIFTRTILWSDQTISDASSPSTPLYHASTYCLDFRQPDIILHASTPSNPKASLLAAAHFRFSRHARLGFGADFAQLNGKDTHDGAVVWESLRNTSTYCRHYQYDFSVPTVSPTPSPAGKDSSSKVTGTRHFRLQRTHAAADGVEGWLGWASFRNYVLVDLATGGDVVAVFLSDDLRSLTRMGELRLYEDLSDEVLAGVVLGVGVVVEKHIRRVRRSGKGGGGGGGGDGGG